jgi:RimJ/RimL family protein N-acetyltransferase
MPWAAEEPKPLEERVALLRRFRGNFDLGTDFVYGIFDREESTVVGGTGLHTRVGEDAFEIGYWIHVDRVREGLVTESTAALTRVALELCDADRVEIRVDPANVASLGVPRKLGYLEEATLRRRLPGQRDVVVWTLFKDALAASPAANASFEAYDAVGARIS